MELVEDTLEVDIEDVLNRRLIAHLATNSPDGGRHAPVWFLWEDEAIWIIADGSKRSFPDRIEREPRCAIGIVDFDPTTGRLVHLGFRGRATIEPHDPERAERLMERYFRAPKSEWDADRFGDPERWGDDFVFVRFEPTTVVARDQSYEPPGQPTDDT